MNGHVAIANFCGGGSSRRILVVWISLYATFTAIFFWRVHPLLHADTYIKPVTENDLSYDVALETKVGSLRIRLYDSTPNALQYFQARLTNTSREPEDISRPCSVCTIYRVEPSLLLGVQRACRTPVLGDGGDPRTLS